MDEGGMRGGIVLSLDFELFWGVRDKRTIADYGQHLLGVRQVVPRLLDMFARYRIAATWATVGMLFFDDRDALVASLPEERPDYADPKLSPYGDLDKVGATERDDPYHFGLSLIRRIAEAPGQEIATHTFSHFYCLEPGPTLAAFAADMDAARRAAEAVSITLESIVFPRNQSTPEHLEVCRDMGLVAWRGNERAAIYRPQAQSAESLAKRAGRLADTYLPLTGSNATVPEVRDGMVDVPSSRFLRPVSRRLAALEPLRLGRILRAMNQAASRDQVFHLWFHPHNFGALLDENAEVLERILAEASRLRDETGWPSRTMAEVARAAGARPADA